MLFSIGKVLEDREAITQQGNQLNKDSQRLTLENLKKTEGVQEIEATLRFGEKDWFFFCICTVLHACFAKPFFAWMTNYPEEEAYVHVHKIADELEMYANDVQLALNCEARGIHLVRATPILVPLKLRLRVIFL